MSEPGRVHHIETSTHLTTWIPLATTTNQTGRVTLTDTESDPAARRYYRPG